MKNEPREGPLQNGAGRSKLSEMLRTTYCKKDLMRFYGISYKTLMSWLRPIASEIGPVKGRYFTTAQMKVIFEELGYPEQS